MLFQSLQTTLINSITTKPVGSSPVSPAPRQDMHQLKSLPSAQGQSRRWRVALYSHDTMGLGHKRRNLLIAQTLGASHLQTDILMISGMRDASHLPTPPGVDCLTLPALYKRADGGYQSRRLEISLKEIIALRSRVIQSAIEAFQPDAFIVDNVPRGAVRELDETLEYLRSQGHTRCILGLRDVLDTPGAVQRDWQRAAYEEAIRDYYDAVWVYGDQSVYDLSAEYALPADITAKFHYTGYLDQRVRLQHIKTMSGSVIDELKQVSGELVLCLVGGGQDGEHLAETFAKAQLPPNTTGVIVTGPFMPPEARERLLTYAALQPRLHILEYVEEPTFLLERADRVIAMGGYNTTCEILSFEKPALLVPRVQPRQEQLIRAERLRQMGVIDVLHPHQVSPQALSDWLAQPCKSPRVRDRIDLNGLRGLLEQLENILTLPRYSTPRAS